MNDVKKQYKVLLDSANFFCKPNIILVSQVEKFVKKNNHTITKDISDADFLVLNTCGFDDKRETLYFEILTDMFKKMKKGSKVIALGCVSVISDQLQKQFPDLLIVQDLSKLDEILNALDLSLLKILP